MNYQPSINPELVQLWSKELSDKEPYVYPFKASYKATNGQLHFIASFHSNKIEFKEWYLLKNKQEFVLSEINEESPAPFYDGKLYTQKVASAVLLARDQFIVTKIADSLKKNKTVLVVYGGSHWSTQSEALENLYGKPTFFK